jgi:hypothetical protein
MPTPTFQPPQGNQSTAQLQDWIIKLVRDLNYLLGNLDTLNVSRLNASVLIAGSITAGKIAADSITAVELAANSVTASEIVAGAVTASKINVSSLSAISANMGTITAGSITTSANIDVGTDMRIGNTLYMNETSSGAKGLIFSTASGNTASINVLSGDMGIKSNGFISMTIGSSMGLVVNKTVVAPSFEASSSITLGGANVLISGANSSFTAVADGHNHGFSNTDYIQCYDAVGTPTLKKQFVGYTGSASHNHFTS